MMESDSSEITRLYRVFRTLKQLLHDRKYLIQETDLLMTLEEFTAQYAKGGKISRSDLTLVAVSTENEEQVMVNFFEGVDKKKIGVAPIRR